MYAVCVAHSNTYMHSHLGRLPARGKAVAVAFAIAIAAAVAAVQFTVYDATATLAKCANATQTTTRDWVSQLASQSVG